LPTTVSARQDAILAAIENVAACPQPDDGSIHLGVHIEGPYFNVDHRGAQNKGHLRDPDPSEYETWFDSGVVKLISIAPERPDALACIQHGVSQGVEFAAGHTGATYEQVIEAADHGRPGTVGAILTDERIYAQVIADGVHVHPAVVGLLIRAKGTAHTILITDAIRAVGLEDGDYMVGDDKIIVKNGVSRTMEGGLAGSTLTMDTAIRNVVSFTGLSFQDVLPMATSVPARAMGWYGRKGVITPGADADITIFDKELQVWMTIVAGRVVYRG
jgi:N-acetylglucosamine-6-phosphate deacetylase